MSITDMSDNYVCMIEKFETWPSDASNLLHYKDTLFGDDAI